MQFFKKVMFYCFKIIFWKNINGFFFAVPGVNAVRSSNINCVHIQKMCFFTTKRVSLMKSSVFLTIFGGTTDFTYIDGNV